MNKGILLHPAEIHSRSIEKSELVRDMQLPDGSLSSDLNLTLKETTRATASSFAVGNAMPAVLKEDCTEALASLWVAASDLANADLVNMQAAWKQERNKMEAERNNLARLYDEQKSRFREAKAALSTAEKALSFAERQVEQLALPIRDVKESLARQVTRFEQMDARAYYLKRKLRIAREQVEVASSSFSDTHIYEAAHSLKQQEAGSFLPRSNISTTALASTHERGSLTVFDLQSPPRLNRP